MIIEKSSPRGGSIEIEELLERAEEHLRKQTVTISFRDFLEITGVRALMQNRDRVKRDFKRNARVGNEEKDRGELAELRGSLRDGSRA